MKKRYWFILIISLMTLILVGCNKNNYNGFEYNGPIKITVNMLLKSPAFLDDEKIPVKYSCDGINVNPKLQIFRVPDGAESLALIVDDVDAVAKEWVHWLVWNINPTTRKIEENSLPLGALEGVNDFNVVGWSGPCPPEKQHKYNFKLYALDTMLNLDEFSRKDDLMLAMEDHVIQQTVLSGYYEKEQ